MAPNYFIFTTTEAHSSLYFEMSSKLFSFQLLLLSQLNHVEIRKPQQNAGIGRETVIVIDPADIVRLWSKNVQRPVDSVEVRTLSLFISCY